MKKILQTLRWGPHHAQAIRSSSGDVLQEATCFKRKPDHSIRQSWVRAAWKQTDHNQRAIFHNLTAPPPVLRTVEPASAQTTEGGSWRHASAIGSYQDADLGAILIYLRAVIKP